MPTQYYTRGRRKKRVPKVQCPACLCLVRTDLYGSYTIYTHTCPNPACAQYVPYPTRKD